MEPIDALDLFRGFGFRTSFTALETRAFGSLPLDRSFLAPWNLTQTALPPRAVDQVNFMALAYASMTLHDFIL